MVKYHPCDAWVHCQQRAKRRPQCHLHKERNTAHSRGELSGFLHHSLILVGHLSYLSIINSPSKQKFHFYRLEMFDMYDQMRLHPELSCFFFTIGFIFF